MMEQIYDFEQHDPPVLTENMIQAELERRKLRWQTALSVLAGILVQVVIVLFGYSAFDWYPWVTFVCFGYVVISTTGSGILAVTHAQKGGITI